MNMYAEVVLNALIKSGWEKDRVVEIENVLSILLQEGYGVNETQLNFLREFTFLNIEYENPRLKDCILTITLDPIKANESIFRDLVEEYEAYCNEKFIIIGEVDKENMTLYMSNLGVFYGGYDNFLIKLGLNFNDMILNLINGIQIKVISIE